MSKYIQIAALLASMMLIPFEVFGAAATVINLSGTLSVQKANGTVKLLSQKSVLDAGDMLSTENDSYARIKFTDGGEITMRPNSVIKIDSYTYKEQEPESDSFVFRLLKGGLRTITGLVGKRGNRDAYRLETASATIGIRGTQYGALWVQNDRPGLSNGLYLDVAEGQINARTEVANRDFTAGQIGYVASVSDQPLLLPTDPGLPSLPSTSSEQGEVLVGDDVGQTPAGAGCVIQ